MVAQFGEFWTYIYLMNSMGSITLTKLKSFLDFPPFIPFTGVLINNFSFLCNQNFLKVMMSAISNRTHVYIWPQYTCFLKNNYWECLRKILRNQSLSILRWSLWSGRDQIQYNPIEGADHHIIFKEWFLNTYIKKKNLQIVYD